MVLERFRLASSLVQILYSLTMNNQFIMCMEHVQRKFSHSIALPIYRPIIPFHRASSSGTVDTLLVEDASTNKSVAHRVRIAIATRSSVLQIPFLVLGNASRYTNTDITIRYASAEIVYATGFAFSG